MTRCLFGESCCTRVELQDKGKDQLIQGSFCFAKKTSKGSEGPRMSVMMKVPEPILPLVLLRVLEDCCSAFASE